MAAAATVTTAAAMKIYTKTGDAGTTSLYNMQRAKKSEDYFEALGDVDELNAYIGLCHEYCVDAHADFAAPLREISSRLMDVGSHIATPLSTSRDAHIARTALDDAPVAALEQWIDAMDSKLPQLKNFILPVGGGPLAQHLHVARTVCRRAERHVCPLVERDDCDAVVQRYLNRLSDYLFVAARYASQQAKRPETIYQKPKAPAAAPAAPAASKAV